MDTQPKLPAYEKVRDLIESIDGDGALTWHPGGAGGGGTWELCLKGKTAQVKFLSDRLNDLDRFYVPEVDNPRTYRDYGSSGRLRDDAFLGAGGHLPPVEKPVSAMQNWVGAGLISPALATEETAARSHERSHVDARATLVVPVLYSSANHRLNWRPYAKAL